MHHLRRLPDTCRTIMAAIKFSRFSDICGVMGAEHIVARKIRSIIVANETNNGRLPNTRPPLGLLLTRRALCACYTRYCFSGACLQYKQHKFAQGTKEIPSFVSHLLLTVSRVFMAAHVRWCRATFLHLVSVDYVISTDITGAPEEFPFSSLVINIFIIFGPQYQCIRQLNT